ncbi:Yae1 family protein [Bacillus sp. Brlt_9]|uniref:Yae1 family protein n=1 Tax=Bacillus sp. Brlt_9 TaxID=3110916 RepID=UPI003F7BB50C
MGKEMPRDLISEAKVVQEHRGDDAMLAYFMNSFSEMHFNALLRDPEWGKARLKNDVKNIIKHLTGPDIFSVYTILFNMSGKLKEESLKSALLEMVEGLEFSNLIGMYSYLLTLSGAYENTLLLNNSLAREFESENTTNINDKESILFNEKNVIVAFEQGKALGELAGIEKGEKAGYNKGFKEGKEIGESTCNKKVMKEEYSKGFEKGNEKGLTTGYLRGEKEGYKQGMKEGRKVGLQKGREEGYTKGYNKGLKDKEKELVEKPVSPDLESAYADGFKNGIVVGEQKSFTEAYNKGYQKALSDSGKPNTTTKQTFDLTEERIKEIREQAHKEGFEEGKTLRIKELRAMREW